MQIDHTTIPAHAPPSLMCPSCVKYLSLLWGNSSHTMWTHNRGYAVLPQARRAARQVSFVISIRGETRHQSLHEKFQLGRQSSGNGEGPITPLRPVLAAANLSPRQVQGPRGGVH